MRPSKRVAAGIGNVYKSEVLFLRGIDPRTRIHQLDLGQLDALYATSREIMLENLGPGARTTRERLSGDVPGDDRYFVVVSAYDFEAAKEKKKVLLWQAKMSTPSHRVALAEVIPSMITAGGPHFGRETKRPESVTAPLAKEGKVEVGTPVVVPDKK